MDNGRFDLRVIRQRDLGHLIKSITVRQERNSGEPVVVVARGVALTSNTTNLAKLETRVGSKRAPSSSLRHTSDCRVTPAMEAGITDDIRTSKDLLLS